MQDFPLIVPLVDKMITMNLKERFTAQEALEFVKKHILGGSTEILDRPLERKRTMKTIFWDPDQHDKWANLPAEFVAKWGMFKAPKAKYHDLVLRRICARVRGGYEVIKFFRSLYGFFWKLFRSHFPV